MYLVLHDYTIMLKIVIPTKITIIYKQKIYIKLTNIHTFAQTTANHPLKKVLTPPNVTSIQSTLLLLLLLKSW